MILGVHAYIWLGGWGFSIPFMIIASIMLWRVHIMFYVILDNLQKIKK